MHVDASHITPWSSLEPSLGTPTTNIPMDHQLFPPQSVATRLRRSILAAVAVYFLYKTFRKQLFPWGTPEPWPTRRQFTSVDTGNTALQEPGVITKISQRWSDNEAPSESLIQGVETVVINKGTIYGMTEEADLIQLRDLKTEEDGHMMAEAVRVRSLGIGRPLGGEFDKDGTLWIADAVLGLTRLKAPSDPHSKVELVADSVVLPDGTVSRLLYTNDLAVGPRTGKIYFTDSSTAVPTRVEHWTWDTLYASKYDAFRASATGRLLQYDPATDQVSILASGFHFANGISVNGDESFLAMAETFGMRLWKYHLKGPKTGEMEVLVENLPGYPDGLSCTTEGRCFAVMPSSIVPLHRLVSAVPDFMDILLRHLVLSLPRQLAPVRRVS